MPHHLFLSTLDRTRTDTVTGLSRLPLPLGYKGKCGNTPSMVVRGTRIHVLPPLRVRQPTRNSLSVSFLLFLPFTARRSTRIPRVSLRIRVLASLETSSPRPAKSLCARCLFASSDLRRRTGLANFGHVRVDV